MPDYHRGPEVQLPDFGRCYPARMSQPSKGAGHTLSRRRTPAADTATSASANTRSRVTSVANTTSARPVDSSARKTSVAWIAKAAATIASNDSMDAENASTKAELPPICSTRWSAGGCR
jgi:hypothetical protein